jgi:hypothetical protein
LAERTSRSIQVSKPRPLASTSLAACTWRWSVGRGWKPCASRPAGTVLVKAMVGPAMVCTMSASTEKLATTGTAAGWARAVAGSSRASGASRAARRDGIGWVQHVIL